MTAMTIERACHEMTCLLCQIRPVLDAVVHDTGWELARARLSDLEDMLARTDGACRWSATQLKAWEAERRRERGW